jgi:mannosyl-3-phosphoglycerate phosphatase
MHSHPVVIVSDVDGTLLDEAGAWPEPPRLLRDRLDRVTMALGAPVTLALASSRTLDELLALQRWLGRTGPCLAEDGAVVALDDEPSLRRRMEALGDTAIETRVAGRRRLLVTRRGVPVEHLRELLRAWPGAGAADVARAPSARLTALGFRSMGQRRRALFSRRASVLLDPAQWRAVVRTAGEHAPRDVAVDIARGGRWSTATQRAGKGAAIDWLRRVLDAETSGTMCAPVRIVGIGNGENDRCLLESVDVPFAVRNDRNGVHPSLRDVPDVHVLDTVGTRAWLEMLDLLPATMLSLQTAEYP